MTKHTILFLAANPQAMDPSGLDPPARRVALDQEAGAIRRELKLSGYRDRFELVTRWAAEPHDLLRELRALKPTVVHFSGHGGRDGLFFQAPNGDARVVSPAAIAETFGAAGASVQLVVLSACYSAEPAEALLAHVDCIVGISGVLRDDMARAFAIGFYGALGDQGSVEAAHRHGLAAISLEGLSDADRPQLRVRAGSDAARIVLAAAAPAVHVALPCPYPGMRPYSADDADHFHGRGAEIDELIGRLRAGEREIYVIGPSGSGKSSLVAAGVLPRLARGVAGLGPFVVRTMRPSEQPAARLGELLGVSDRKLTSPAEAITALLGGRAFSSSVLILIDQLEELFTLADAGERERFLSALAALRAEPRCVVVFTLRADFFGAFMESPLCTGRRGRLSRIEVYPLRGEALSEAIVRPARDLGVSLEPELIERLLSDAGSEPGILPLLHWPRGTQPRRSRSHGPRLRRGQARCARRLQRPLTSPAARERSLCGVGSLGTGDPGGNGSLGGRWRQPEHHRVYFVLEVVDELDLGASERVLQGEDARGACSQREAHPTMEAHTHCSTHTP